MSPPLSWKSLRPVCASKSRQISLLRRTKGMYISPSAMALRVMRVSPWLEPIVCGGSKRSMPRTVAPRRLA